MAPAEDVNVQVRHGFAGIGAVVHDEPVAGSFQARLFSDFGRLEHQMAKEFLIVGRGLGDARHGFLRNDKDVHRRLGSNVAEGEYEFVFKHDLCGKFARRDFLEKSFHLVLSLGKTHARWIF